MPTAPTHAIPLAHRSRRLLSLLLAVLLAVLLAASVLTALGAGPARAATTVTLDGVRYSLEPDTPGAEATVTYYDTSYGTDVDLPDTIRVSGADYPVTTIGPRAFLSAGLTSLRLPAGLTTVRERGFALNALTSVTLPDTLTVLEDYAFQDNQLTSVEFPDTLTSIGYAAYLRNRLTSVDIPDSVTSIGNYAFSENDLTRLTLSNGLTGIGNYAFYSNELTAVTLPPAVTTVGQLAYAQNKLESVVLPDALTTIGLWAFRSNRLTAVDLPEALTTIDSQAFRSNRLTSVEIPAGVTTLGDEAFALNPALTRVRFSGPAPTVITGADASTPSLGDAPGLTVAFHARYLAHSPEPGFTTPDWLGYAALPAYTVTFDSGDDPAFASETIWPGETVRLPAAPERTGYTFTGWYTSPDGGEPFDPETPLTDDLTVHAGWRPTSVPATPVTPASGSLSGGSLEMLIAVARQG